MRTALVLFATVNAVSGAVLAMLGSGFISASCWGAACFCLLTEARIARGE